MQILLPGQMNLAVAPDRSPSLALRGLVAAAFTPMNPDTSVAVARIGPLVDFVLGQGATGLYVLGSTGEGPLLTTVERRAAAQAFVRAARGRAPVIVQVGHASIAESKELSRHAAESGADAFSATPPMYFRPESLDVLVACMAEIASAAPALPFYYYHLPGMTGVRFSMTAFLDRAATCIPNIRGIKFSDPLVYEMDACRSHQDGRFDIVFGSDEMMLSGFVAGAKGAVGSSYNFAAPLFRRIIDAFEAGHLAEAATEQRRAARMLDVILQTGGRGGLKATMALCGFDCGPSRLPIVTPSDAQVRAIKEALERLGLLRRPGDAPEGSSALAPLAAVAR